MTVFANNIRRIFTSPISIVFMLIIPIVLNVAIITAVTQPARYSVGVICPAYNPIVQAILDDIARKYAVKSKNDLDVGKQEMLDNTIDCIVVIPSSYSKDVLLGAGKVDIYFRPGDNATIPLQKEMETLFDNVNAIGKKSGGDSVIFTNDLRDYLNGSFEVSYKYTTVVSSVVIDRVISALGYLAVAMLFFITFSTMLIFKDRECGVFARLCASPLGRMSYFFQNLLSFLLVAALQVVILVLILPCFVDISFGKSIEQLLGTMFVTFLFAACCIGIGVAVSSLSSNVVVMSTIVSFINVPMLMLGGCFWPSSYMPVGLQVVGSCIPTGWFLNAAKCIISGEGLEPVFFFSALLVALTVIALLVAYVFSFSEFASRQGLSKVRTIVAEGVRYDRGG